MRRYLLRQRDFGKPSVVRAFLALPRVLAAAAVLVLGVPAVGQESPSPPATAGGTTADEDIDKARELMDKGRFVEVLTVLRPLAEHRPVQPDVLFLIGLAGIEASQQPGISDKARDALLDAAITALRDMLVKEPGLVRVRLELGRAFFLKGEDTLAKRHFERVLAGKPPAAVVLNVSRFLAQIRARKRWSTYVGFALAPDTNIGGASDERTIYIHGLPFQRDAEDLTTSGVGISVWGGGEYQYPLGERLRLRAGGDVSRREYKGGRFDQMFVAGHVGPRWLVGRNTEASLLGSVQRRWYGNDRDFDAFGVRAEAGHRFARGLTAHARVSWHDRKYRRDFLDGPVVDASLGGSWVVTPVVRTSVAAGWGRERTEAERWRHERWWVRAGASVLLPWGFTAGGSGELRWTDYEGNWFPHTSGEAREDRTRSLRASLHHRAFTLFGFSPQVALVHEVRKTNAQLYDYKRLGGELRFVRQF